MTLLSLDPNFPFIDTKKETSVLQGSLSFEPGKFSAKTKKKMKQNVSRTSGTHKVATVLIFLHSHKVYRT